MEHLADIDRVECLRLLEEHGFGRMAVVVRGYPLVFPVNYALVDGAILACIRQGGDLDRATSGTAVSFQIDGEDSVYHEGWSVLAAGRCEHLPHSVERDRHARGVNLSPWAGRDRSLFVRITIDELSGRRIDHRAG